MDHYMSCNSDEENEDHIRQQAVLAKAKYGNMQRSPMIAPEKRKFDSGDYFKEFEKLRQAAGLAPTYQQSQGNILEDHKEMQMQ
eukprot:403377501